MVVWVFAMMFGVGAKVLLDVPMVLQVAARVWLGRCYCALGGQYGVYNNCQGGA